MNNDKITYMENEKNKNPKRRIILHLSIALTFMTVLVIAMMAYLVFTITDMNKREGKENACIDSLLVQNRAIRTDINTIKSCVIPSDSIYECFVGHNPKIRGAYVVVYTNNPFSLKEGEKINIMNQNAEGAPCLTLKVRVNTLEKEPNSRATMFINTETFKTLGIEGKGLDQGVFMMQYKRIR